MQGGSVGQGGSAHSRSMRRVALSLVLTGLVACGGGGRGDSAGGESSVPSGGQVAAPGTVGKVSYFAASRFAEQASFGPTPALVERVQALGFEKWIDEQFAITPSQIDLAPYLDFTDPPPQAQMQRYFGEFANLAISAPDQLRLRVTWAIEQYITISERKGDIVGVMTWINMLQQHVLSTYANLLYHVTINPMMGQYQDNVSNRPRSSECPSCSPNENFARELMQLFSLGVNKLKPDGTPERDARGRLIETYSQRDVEQMARALTGWDVDPNPPNRPARNYHNWAKPMVAATWPPFRDSGSKQILGRDFPAGQTQEKDLRDITSMLAQHPNAGPFVALRLVQHLVKSDPTPAYIGRVAARFRDNGNGVVGDLKAVVKAVLLDPEARAGDNPAEARRDDGKFKEPFLHSIGQWRGLGCQVLPRAAWGGVALTGGQPPFAPANVFSFYVPTDRAPGSNLLAPEQRLMTPQELRERASLAESPTTVPPGGGSRVYTNFDGTGCDLTGLRGAFVHSPRAFSDYLAVRYFRGAMPPTLRSNIEQLMREPGPPWNVLDPSEGALRMLGYALLTPYYGIIK